MMENAIQAILEHLLEPLIFELIIIPENIFVASSNAYGTQGQTCSHPGHN